MTSIWNCPKNLTNTIASLKCISITVVFFIWMKYVMSVDYCEYKIPDALFFLSMKPANETIPSNERIPSNLLLPFLMELLQHLFLLNSFFSPIIKSRKCFWNEKSADGKVVELFFPQKYHVSIGNRLYDVTQEKKLYNSNIVILWVTT